MAVSQGAPPSLQLSVAPLPRAHAAPSPAQPRARQRPPPLAQPQPAARARGTATKGRLSVALSLPLAAGAPQEHRVGPDHHASAPGPPRAFARAACRTAQRLDARRQPHTDAWLRSPTAWSGPTRRRGDGHGHEHATVHAGTDAAHDGAAPPGPTNVASWGHVPVSASAADGHGPAAAAACPGCCAWRVWLGAGRAPPGRRVACRVRRTRMARSHR